MHQLELSGRLSAAAEWIPEHDSVADIGTDHGFLPVFLLQSGRADRMIATDIKSRPLEKAKACARKYALEEKISFRLCDGLSGVLPEEAETIVIAGMGGENIAAILSAAPWTAEGAHRLILQPMSKTEELRRFLCNSGYAIEAERLVCEKNELYVLLLARGGAKPFFPGAGMLYTGHSQTLREDPLYPEYLDQQRKRLERAIAGAKRSSKACDFERLEEFKSAYRDLMNLREELRHADGTGDL
jgi:tRNA (adenine22-N1)-methyltransferase